MKNHIASKNKFLKKSIEDILEAVNYWKNLVETIGEIPERVTCRIPGGFLGTNAGVMPSGIFKESMEKFLLESLVELLWKQGKNS